LGLLSYLKFDSANDQYLYSYSGTNSVGGIRFDSPSGDIYFFNAPSGAVTAGSAFNYSGNTKLIIKSSGNVGIGTTNPTYPLAVHGTIEATEVIVQTGWSDYVFDKSYHLTPLSEVESYIKTEHHLPGVPSEKQIAAKGVSVGDMQSRLLAQIEQLTLHVIDQDKKIQELEKRLDQQKDRSAL
jgi:hypothetical protein